MFDLSAIDFDAMLPEEQDELLQVIRAQEFAEQARSLSLYDFVKHFWSTVEPQTAFIDNWHIGAICEHAEACYTRQIRNLIINIPPRSLKSIIMSVMFTAWVWTKDPGQRFITASFAIPLALKDADNCRALIKSPEYQAYFGEIYRLETGNQDAKGYYKTSSKGFRRSFGVGSSIVGEGGDINIVDDPNNPLQKETAADREAVNFWLASKWYSRVNDYNSCVRILVQQRTHVNDATACLIAKDLGFEVLKIPFRYKGEKNRTSIGYSDPREKLDEIFSPKRIFAEEAAKLEKSLGTDAPAQLQQDPISKEGNMFPPSKVRIVSKDEIPNNLILVRFWDKAFTEGGGAYTAGVLIGKEPRRLDYYILDVVRGQWEPMFRDQMIGLTAMRDSKRYGGKLKKVFDKDGKEHEVWLGGRVKIVLEQEPGSTGRDANKILIRSVLSGYNVRSEPASGDKVTRAEALSSQWNAGNVMILEGDWNTEYMNEMAGFPNGLYKDQVDASSGGFNKLAKLRIA